MALEPLEQWICDRCGGIINSPEEGWVEWTRDEDCIKGEFKIVHNASASPRGKASDYCYHHMHASRRSDINLTEFLGDQGIICLLSMLDTGPFHTKNYVRPEVKDFREFVDLFRRLHVPYYEEARQYWEQAMQDGLLNTLNEISVYSPNTLREVIAHYSS